MDTAIDMTPAAETSYIDVGNPAELPEGDMSIVFWMAEQERRRHVARVTAGLAGAKARGTKLGRPKGTGKPLPLSSRKVDPQMAASLREQGTKVKDIATRFKVSRQAVYNALREAARG